jgi:hypothetical protein
MLNENMKAKGELFIKLFSEDGLVKDERHIKNLVVNGGLEHITTRLVGTGQGVMTHMAIGTTNTAAAGAQTALLGEVFRKSFSSSAQATTTTTNDAVEFQATFGPSEPGSAQGIVEAGLFNDPSAGNMLARTVFSVINKETTDTLAITWKITFTAN